MAKVGAVAYSNIVCKKINIQSKNNGSKTSETETERVEWCCFDVHNGMRIRNFEFCITHCVSDI